MHGTSFQLYGGVDAESIPSRIGPCIASLVSDSHDHLVDIAETSRRLSALAMCATDPDKLPRFANDPMASRSKKPGDPNLVVTAPAFGAALVNEETTMEDEQMMKMRKYRQQMGDAFGERLLWRKCGEEAKEDPEVALRGKLKGTASSQEHSDFVISFITGKRIAREYNEWKNDEMRGPDSDKRKWKRESWMDPKTPEMREVWSG